MHVFDLLIRSVAALKQKKSDTFSFFVMTFFFVLFLLEASVSM